MPNPRWTHDHALAKGHLGIVGVDEAGRGCLAGPVVAGAVIIPASFFSEAQKSKATDEMNDSKQFDETKREKLYERVMALGQQEKIFGMGTDRRVWEEIEEHNIVGASLPGDDACDEDGIKSEWWLLQTVE